MFKTKKQLLTRFLKENNIYHRIIDSDEYAMIESLLGKREITVDFFDAGMCWGSTSEGHNYWLKMQCEFIVFIIKYGYGNVFSVFDIKIYFSKLINSGYFSDIYGEFSKNGNYYKKLTKIFNEKFG